MSVSQGFNPLASFFQLFAVFCFTSAILVVLRGYAPTRVYQVVSLIAFFLLGQWANVTVSQTYGWGSVLNSQWALWSCLFGFAWYAFVRIVATSDRDLGAYAKLIRGRFEGMELVGEYRSRKVRIWTSDRFDASQGWPSVSIIARMEVPKTADPWTLILAKGERRCAADAKTPELRDRLRIGHRRWEIARGEAYPTDKQVRILYVAGADHIEWEEGLPSRRQLPDPRWVGAVLDLLAEIAAGQEADERQRPAA